MFYSQSDQRSDQTNIVSVRTLYFKLGLGGVETISQSFREEREPKPGELGIVRVSL